MSSAMLENVPQMAYPAAAGMTPMVQVQVPMQLPNGQIILQTVLVPYYGQLPSNQQIPVVNSFPTLAPVEQPTPSETPVESEAAREDPTAALREKLKELSGGTEVSGKLTPSCVVKTFEIPSVPEEPEVVQVEEPVIPREPKNLNCKAEFPSLPPLSLSRNNSDSSSELETEEANANEALQKDEIVTKEFTKAFLYRTLKRIRVRQTNSIDGDVVGILEKNEDVKVVKIEGRKARIVSPLNGWVSLKKKKEKQISRVFKGTPTVCLTNVPFSRRGDKELRNFLREKGFRPSRIVRTKTNALIEFAKHKEAFQLLKSDLHVGGSSLKFEWGNRYANEVTV